MNRWSRDGWEAEVRIGLLVPHADVGPESECQAMAPESVRVHATRVPFGAMASGGAMDPTIPLAPVRAFAEAAALDEAAELLAAAPLDAIGFAFTSSAYVIGADGEAEMLKRLAANARGIPVVAATNAMVTALGALGARRVALVSPPWFDAELSELGRAYFEKAGCDVVAAASAALPSDQRAVTPAALIDWVVATTPADAEAVVIGGNGFRAVGAVAPLEETLARPVVTANQALFWAALRAAGANTASVKGYGRLFENDTV